MLSKTFSVRSLPFQDQTQFTEMSTSKTRQKGEEESSLQVLHSKLQEEAEKIVRWKVSTEVTLNQKERQLNEAQKVIKVLRNNVMEQQLNSEHLSQSLLREKNHREQIVEQVTVTRHVCDALMQRHRELQTSVTEFHSVREQLEAVHENAKEQIKSLTTRFEDVALKHRSAVDEVASKADARVSAVTHERNKLRDSLRVKEEEVEALTDETELLRTVERMCGQRLFAFEEGLEAVTARCHWTTRCLEQVKTSFSIIKSELDGEILSLRTITDDLRQKLKKESERLSESHSECKEAAEKVEYLTRCNAVLQGSEEELLQQLQAIKDQKEEMQKTFLLTSEKYDELLKMSSDQESALKKGKEEFELHLKSCMENLEKKNKENKDILRDFEEVSGKIETIQRMFEEEKSTLINDLKKRSNEKEVLARSLIETEDQLKLMTGEKEKETSITAKMKKEIHGLEKNLSLANEEAKRANDQLVSLSEELQAKTFKLDEALKKEEELQITKGTQAEEIRSLQEELQKEQDTCKNLEKDLQYKDKLLASEQKKNEKFKAKLQTLESRLKDKDCKSKEDLKSFKETIEELRSKVDSLEAQKNNFETIIEEVKEKNTKVEESLKEQVAGANEARLAAEENAKESDCKKELAEMEANSKIKEMMDLAECWKRDSEMVLESKNEENSGLKRDVFALKDSLSQAEALQKKLENEKKELEKKLRIQDEEILTARDKLTCKINEFNELKTAIKSLTESDKKTYIVNSPLKTPSPSEYLTLCNISRGFGSLSNDETNSSVKSPEISRVTTEVTKTEQKRGIQQRNQKLSIRQSILKQGSIKNLMSHTKNVSFLSPVFYKGDSDSSDGFALEVGSDVDDRFEAIRRSSQIRQRSSDIKKAIPKANIHPIPRAPFVPFKQDSQQQLQSVTRSINPPAIKRARYDRSSLKTYASPKGNIRGAERENNPPEERQKLSNVGDMKKARSLSFESVFALENKK